MAVKRDYGNFAKASTRLLASQVESLGYRQWYAGGFGREKAGWVEGFFLQQSQFGSSDFCVNVGIHVPGLEDLWAIHGVKRGFGLLIAWRVSDGAPEHGAERWFHAIDAEQLENNLKAVAAALATSDPWFEQFQSFWDVVEQYRVRSGLPNSPIGDPRIVAVLNYGLLLFLANAKHEAAKWLRFARELLASSMYWDAKTRSFSREPGRGLRLVTPTKDDELRRRMIDWALARLEL